MLLVYINKSIRIPSDLLGSIVITHPYFIRLSLLGRGQGEGDSCIRVGDMGPIRTIFVDGHWIP
jgi:hypothetical protein